MHKSRALQIAIDTSIKYIPSLKKYSKLDYDSKLKGIQQYVRTLIKTKHGKRKNTVRRKHVQRGGNSELYTTILISIYAVLVTLWILRLHHSNTIANVTHPMSLTINEMNNIDLLLLRASYNPILLDELRGNYPGFAQNARSYIDTKIMSEYGTTLADFVIQPMPPHPVHYNNDYFENEDEYITAVIEWEQAYIARHERGLSLPEEHTSLLPNGFAPSPLLFTTANAEHIGERNVPTGSDNIISMNAIENGDEMVELHGLPMHYYKRSSINSLLSAPGSWPKTNPVTRQNIANVTNMKRYTAKVRRNERD